MNIKCSNPNCDKQEEVPDDIIGWYCKPCMLKIMGNIETWLNSEECKKIERNFWEKAGEDYKNRSGCYTRIIKKLE